MSAPLEYLSSAPTTEGYRLHFVALTAEGVATLRAALGDLEASYAQMIKALSKSERGDVEPHFLEERDRAAAMLDELVQGSEAG